MVGRRQRSVWTGTLAHLSISDGNKCGVKLVPPIAPPTALLMETGGRMIGGEGCDVAVTSPSGAGPGEEAAPSARRLRSERDEVRRSECCRSRLARPPFLCWSLNLSLSKVFLI